MVPRQGFEGFSTRTASEERNLREDAEAKRSPEKPGSRPKN